MAATYIIYHNWVSNANCIKIYITSISYLYNLPQLSQQCKFMKNYITCVNNVSTWTSSFVEYCPFNVGSTNASNCTLSVSCGKAYQVINYQYLLVIVVINKKFHVNHVHKQRESDRKGGGGWERVTQDTRTPSPGGRFMSTGTRPVRSSNKTTP